MFSITGNQAFDYFIMQSQEYLNKIMESYSNSQYKYIDPILMQYKLDQSDFTDTDWKIIEQYLWKGDD